MGKPDIKAAFFDIDGTLISFKTHSMPDSTCEALHALREKGIKVYVATGRTHMMLSFLDRYFIFDGYLALNGQYCCSRDGAVIRKRTIAPTEIERLQAVLKERSFPCLYVKEHEMFLNYADETVKTLCRRIDQPVPPVSPLKPEDYGNIIQFVPFLKEGEEGFLRDALQDVVMARSVPDCIDVLPAGGGKDAGMAAVLEKEGLSPEQAIAFGDGLNDISMIAFAGTGVAMGNAREQLKAAADFVTKSVDDGGILHALRYFGVL